MICLNQILASSTSKSSHSLSLQRIRKLNEGLLRQNGDHNIIYIQTASPPGKKKTLAMQYSTSQMVNWRLWSRVPTRVVGCTCIQQGLEGLHHNAHVWSKISFILHAQCSNCCKLFEGCKETNKHFNSMTSVGRQKINEENQATCHCFDITSKHCSLHNIALSYCLYLDIKNLTNLRGARCHY